MSKYAIKDKDTGEIEEERYDTKLAAEAAFESNGGDYDYYEIVEVNK